MNNSTFSRKHSKGTHFVYAHKISPADLRFFTPIFDLSQAEPGFNLPQSPVRERQPDCPQQPTIRIHRQTVRLHPPNSPSGCHKRCVCGGQTARLLSAPLPFTVRKRQGCGKGCGTMAGAKWHNGGERKGIFNIQGLEDTVFMATFASRI